MNQLFKIIKITRPLNLSLIAIFMYTFRYGLLKPNDILLNLSSLNYLLLTISLILITAAGYVINDITDQKSDAINKPHKVIVGKLIDENLAFNLYIILNVLGVLIGFWVSHAINKPNFVIYFIVMASMLYFYATYLQNQWFLGNLTVALVVALGLCSIIIFDLLSIDINQLTTQHVIVIKVMMDYVYFGFLITLIREITKDLQDQVGDQKLGANTLPIWLGQKPTKLIITSLIVVLVALVFGYAYENLIPNNLYLSTLYLFALIIAPLIWSLVYLWQQTSHDKYKILSQIYKLVMLFGIISVAVINYQIQHKL